MLKHPSFLVVGPILIDFYSIFLSHPRLWSELPQLLHHHPSPLKEAHSSLSWGKESLCGGDSLRRGSRSNQELFDISHFAHSCDSCVRCLHPSLACKSSENWVSFAKLMCIRGVLLKTSFSRTGPPLTFDFRLCRKRPNEIEVGKCESEMANWIEVEGCNEAFFSNSTLSKGQKQQAIDRTLSRLLTGIQVLGSGAKLVPLYFYFLHSSALDIYLVEKVKNHKTIELKRSMEWLIVSRQYTTINHWINITI
jgi:hypothetical protein